ncbi:MAG: YggT family protein [Betaproteobacteria bacterium]|nr:YggT family protein [Betaproteobacteria bacterium]
MLAQIAQVIIDTAVGLIVLLLLARFHFQWMRVSFRNAFGGFIIAATNWIVMPLRRILPGLAGLDLASLVAAILVQGFGLFLIHAVIGRPYAGSLGETLAVLAALAFVDLLRLSLYLLVFALIVQAVISWINPYSPIAPVFNALTRPFLRPLRGVVPPIGNVDISPLVLIVLLQVLLIPLAYLREYVGLML